MRIRYLAVFLSLLALLLAACGSCTQPTPTESPISPPVTPTQPEPGMSPVSTPSGSAAGVVKAAKEHLAAELNIAPEQIEALAAEPVDWPDASLGCPEPGKAYIQVITPGYRVLLEAEGKTYELHTDETGRNVVICDSSR